MVSLQDTTASRESSIFTKTCSQNTVGKHTVNSAKMPNTKQHFNGILITQFEIYTIVKAESQHENSL